VLQSGSLTALEQFFCSRRTASHFVTLVRFSTENNIPQPEEHYFQADRKLNQSET